MAHLTNDKFKQMVSSKRLKNCSVVPDNITTARSIFGPNLLGLRGKTVRQRLERVVPEYLDIPRDYYRLHHFVTLTADIMFVNGLLFLITMSRDIRFGTDEHILSRTARQLAKSLMKVVKVYALRGFVVQNVLMEGEFEKIKPEMCMVNINISAAREHVGKIERFHQTLKERCRSVLWEMKPVGSGAYMYLHKQIVIRLVYIFASR